ncbi:hypothetical protein KSP39_PZI002031 [Platanthera zijinensis]|uniref:Uncharacterized protein n=1 Tax=Platanthera zijinensis TaxID=2320716 RepID=A0AAP0BZT1_9ASPA
MGLGNSFSQVRGKILLMDPLPPINKVFALILQEEKQCELGFISSSNDSPLAFAVQNTSKFYDNKLRTSAKIGSCVLIVVFWDMLRINAINYLVIRLVIRRGFLVLNPSLPLALSINSLHLKDVQQSRKIGKGKLVAGLYILSTTVSPPSTVCLQSLTPSVLLNTFSTPCAQQPNLKSFDQETCNQESLLKGDDNPFYSGGERMIVSSLSQFKQLRRLVDLMVAKAPPEMLLVQDDGSFAAG